MEMMTRATGCRVMIFSIPSMMGSITFHLPRQFFNGAPTYQKTCTLFKEKNLLDTPAERPLLACLLLLDQVNALTSTRRGEGTR